MVIVTSLIVPAPPVRERRDLGDVNPAARGNPMSRAADAFVDYDRRGGALAPAVQVTAPCSVVPDERNGEKE
jgi:hypothetical protein